MKWVLIILLFITQSAIAGENVFVVQKDDNLTKYFSKLGLSQSLLMNLIHSSSLAKKLNNLRVGKNLVITTRNNKFKHIYYEYSANNALIIDLKGTRFYNRIVYLTKNTSKHTIIINKNLSFDAKKAGFSYAQILQISKVLSQKMNPSSLKKQDIITVYFANNTIKKIVFKGRDKEYLWYKWGNLFYDKNGTIVQDMFLSAPLNYKRISSGFSYNRYHPILKVNKPHRAIDYAANYGTKVWTTSDGVVDFKGFKGALGNTVIINHRYNYQSVYAHLSKFKAGLYVGKKIKKGEVIGFVGSTGRSTGNHLHYELKSYKSWVNPLIHRPKISFKLGGNELKKFKESLNNL